MEQPYRTSRIPREGTYFQRLPRELNDLVSLYDYDCNFDVVFDQTTHRADMGALDFYFEGVPRRVTLNIYNYNNVQLKSYSGFNQYFTTEPKHIVRDLLQNVQNGMKVYLFIGKAVDIILENSQTHPHIFMIRNGRQDIIIHDIPLCRQLVSALLKIYPGG